MNLGIGERVLGIRYWVLGIGYWVLGDLELIIHKKGGHYEIRVHR
jgi:hypothetical protein